MNRRDMLKAGVAAGALGLAPRLASAGVTFAPTPKGWRSYVMTMRVEPTDGATKAWIPLPTFTAADWQRPGTVTWTGNAKVAERVRDPLYGAEMLRVEWAADQQIAADRGDGAGPDAGSLGDPGPGLGAAAQRCRAQAQPRRHRTAAAQRRREGDAPRKSSGAGPATSPRRARSSTGSSTTPSAMPRHRAAAGRHHGDDQDRQPQRQMCRPQRALCRPRPLGRPAGARPLRHPRRALAVRLQGAGRQHSKSSARPSTAAPKSGWRAAAGRRSIPPTCARSCSRSRRAIWR